MGSEGSVEDGVLTGADAGAVEALQADIEAFLVIDGVETLGTVLAIDGLVWFWGFESWSRGSVNKDRGGPRFSPDLCHTE